jgi:nucleotide-binding universal stress UspA family protein
MIRISKILCPIDFFPPSKNAMQYAAGLARNYEARLKLLHVVSPMVPTAYEYVDMAAVVASMKTRSKLELAKTLKKLKESGVEASGEVRTGEIFFGIKEAIQSYEPDLIVMGTHGRRTLQRWLLGSVTESLLRHSPVPMLTVSSASRPATAKEGGFKRILVTTDFSVGTSDALNYAFSIAQENQSHVIVIHAVDHPLPFGGMVMKALERKLAGLVPGEAKSWCDVETRLVGGTPYQCILEIAAKEDIDLIVMNIHGKGMLERALLGSNAERVVRGASCPVMLIPPMTAKRPTQRQRSHARLPAAYSRKKSSGAGRTA